MVEICYFYVILKDAFLCKCASAKCICEVGVLLYIRFSLPCMIFFLVDLFAV